MPLSKVLFKPGVNRENTRYTTEGGWYEGDKIRFRQGNPEKIGGWQRISSTYYLGVCRSLFNWVTLGGANLLGVGTNLKFYIERGGAYYDITPIRASSTINANPFVATNGSTLITVTDTAHGCTSGDFVTFSGAVGLGGNITAGVLNSEYQVSVIDANSYTITASVAANATDAAGSPGGGASVVAAYQIPVGPATAVPISGWGGGGWGFGAWGVGVESNQQMRLWSQSNFGEDLVYNPRGGGIYYWDHSLGTSVRGVNIASLPGASNCPTAAFTIAVSDASRFLLAFGCNEVGESSISPMLIRWSDQENIAEWTQAATNQAGSLQLSTGSEIVTAVQNRQEFVVFTDSAVYSLQYLGPPYIWGSQLMGSNISIAGPNAATTAAGIVYWMGLDKFYAYDGRVQTLDCDLRRYVFNDFSLSQSDQVFAGTNEGFNEIWWFYCSANSTVPNKYVIYNYVEKIWYYGNLDRSAWLDAPLRGFPLAATYSNNIVQHESGVDDNTTGTPVPIQATIASSEFDIGDGHNFGFVWRILPDLTFSGSSSLSGSPAPRVTMTLQGLTNSGSGVTQSAGQNVVKGSTYVITEEFTGQIYTRVRGRQMILKIDSTQLGTTWQLGAPRIDIRPDGRR